MRTRNLAIPAAALALCAAAVVPAAASSGGGSSAGAAGTHTVTLHEIRFHPASLTIKRGETVKWVWRDSGVEHNVTGPGFHSHTQENGSFRVRFNRRGTFRYRCTIHEAEGMRGKVVVR
jgi:plastocyanin